MYLRTNILLKSCFCYLRVDRVPETLEVIEEKASSDPVHRKLFVRGLHYDTQKPDLEEAFAACMSFCFIVLLYLLKYVHKYM